MSLAGLKKQFNKANQYLNEKVLSAKGTELDDDFIEMERKVDVTSKLVDDLITRTHEFLQPNPVSRAKMATSNTISKVRGQSSRASYTQPEGTLGETMIKYSKDLGDESAFGGSLAETGDSFKQLAEIKYALEDSIKQNFIEPLTHLQTKDIKEINHHRKKVSGRRLDYDCKRRKKEKGGANISEDDVVAAENKFEESKELAETAMNNLLDNDVEQISQLCFFIEAQLDYHRQAADILNPVFERLQDLKNEAANRPKVDHVPKRITSFRKPTGNGSLTSDRDSLDIGRSGSFTPPPSRWQELPDKPKAGTEPSCRGLYDFEPENEGELAFNEGDIIKLSEQIDENWFEGELNGQHGYFPTNYVEVIVPLN